MGYLGYRFVLGCTVVQSMVLFVSLGHRYFDLGENFPESIACICREPAGAICYLKRTVCVGAMGSVHANWRACYRGGVCLGISENRFTIRISRNVELIPGVGYISGALGSINFQSELPHSALRVDVIFIHSFS